MFNPKKKESKLDTAIESTIDEYAAYLTSPDEAHRRAETLVVLAEAKHALERKRERDPRIFMTVITSVTSLLGIAIITQHERLHVLASKALPFVTRV